MHYVVAARLCIAKGCEAHTGAIKGSDDGRRENGKRWSCDMRKKQETRKAKIYAAKASEKADPSCETHYLSEGLLNR